MQPPYQYDPGKGDRWRAEDMVDAALRAITLSGEQLALQRALREKDSSLAAMYYGVLLVLGQTENPDRFPLAAHGVREIMEKLPRYVELPEPAAGVDENPGGMNSQAQALCDEWDRTIRNSQRRDSQGWAGEIDQPLRRLLKKLDGFVAWVKRNKPQRKQLLGRFLSGLDPAGGQLPTSIVKLVIDDWEARWDFFVSVAHHRRPCEDPEFVQQLESLQVFLLDRLIPRTFEDRELIDAIIREGELNAES